jgi:hypothetical protein
LENDIVKNFLFGLFATLTLIIACHVRAGHALPGECDEDAALWFAQAEVLIYADGDFKVAPVSVISCSGHDLFVFPTNIGVKAANKAIEKFGDRIGSQRYH